MDVNYDDFNWGREGLSYKGQPFTDFNLSVKEKKIIYDTSSDNTQTKYLVEAKFTDGRPIVQRWIDNLKHIDLFIHFGVNDSMIQDDVRRLLVFKLMHEAGIVSCQTNIYSRLGIQEITGCKIFVLGENVIGTANIPINDQVITHYKMMPSKGYTDNELLERCSSYIHLIPRVSELLFYGSLFAVIKPFLAQLNIPCGFVLALVAPSGHLKTTLARLYALWLYPPSEQETGFHSPQRDSCILDKIDHLQGQNFLLDDIHKITDTNKSRRQENRLDIVARHVSEKSDCANVIITGETMEKLGIFSCMDRVFQIRIPEMNAVQIEDLKKKISSLESGIMPSVAAAFVKSLMENYEEVQKDILNFYEANAIDKGVDNGYATRAYVHAMFIRMTQYLFRKYLCDLNLYLLRDEEAFEIGIKEQIRMQQAELQKVRAQEETHNYIAELYGILQADGKYIQVCGKSSYFANDNSCLLEEERIYITTSAIKKAFFNRYQRYIPPKAVIDALHNEGILEEELNSNGRQKNYNGKKHYVINRCMLVNYLCRNNCSILPSDREKFIQKELL